MMEKPTSKPLSSKTIEMMKSIGKNKADIGEKRGLYVTWPERDILKKAASNNGDKSSLLKQCAGCLAFPGVVTTTGTA